MLSIIYQHFIFMTDKVLYFTRKVFDTKSDRKMVSETELLFVKLQHTK